MANRHNDFDHLECGKWSPTTHVTGDPALLLSAPNVKCYLTDGGAAIVWTLAVEAVVDGVTVVYETWDDAAREYSEEYEKWVENDENDENDESNYYYDHTHAFFTAAHPSYGAWIYGAEVQRMVVLAVSELFNLTYEEIEELKSTHDFRKPEFWRECQKLYGGANAN